LLVGIFTPAIRATDFSPVADPWETAVFCYLGQVFTNANTTPFPLVYPGARHRLKTIRLDKGLIKGFNLVSSTVAMP
jgi:hypothetical protein